MQCDIENFYGSISQDLFKKILSWARSKTYISDTAIDVILCARRNVLFDGTDVWIRKQDSEFDIGMGSFDGAECSELTGLYLLNKMIHEDKIYSPEEVVLYRDDMLTLSEGSGPVIERRRKAMIKLFKEERLSITWEANLDRVQFLDVLFDLKDGSYRP